MDFFEKWLDRAQGLHPKNNHDSLYIKGMFRADQERLARRIKRRISEKKRKEDPAMNKAMEMMKTPIDQLPSLARSYAAHQCAKYGGCMEVFLTAWAHYCQCVLHLECKNEMYIADEEAKAFFAGIK